MSYGSYKCIVCHFIAATIAELHRHQTSSHSTEQLSLSIIQFQNFVKSNKENFDGSCQYNILFRDAVDIINKDVHLRRKYEEFEEQNEPLCLKKPKTEVFAIKEEIHLEEKPEDSSLFADIRLQEMFLSWELELNKTLEISEDEFRRTIDILCKDLSNPNCRAPKRFRKPKTIIMTKKKRSKSKNGRKNKRTKIVENSTDDTTMYSTVEVKGEMNDINQDYMNNGNNDNMKYENIKNEITYSNDMYRKTDCNVGTEMSNFYNDNIQSDSYLFANDINSLFDNISEDFGISSNVSQAYPNVEYSNPSIVMSSDNQVSLLKL